MTLSRVPRRIAAAASLVAALVASVAAQNAPAQAPAREPLTVMSFNIRYGTANDGDNRWPLRREFLFDVIKTANPDLVGLQEALDAQIRELLEALPHYAVVGVGRDDGKTRGEYSAILYRRDRFRVADSGTFWFSDTPETVASRSWGNTITRICTWARFVDHGGHAFWHYNLHLDHQSQPSRERSAGLLAERIAARRLTTEPVVITGDFNAGETNPAVTRLTASQGGVPAAFIDTWRARHPDEKVAGTFSGFKFNETGGDKIDYVLVQPGTEILAAEIIRTSRNDRYPSDHFPVIAQVILR